MVETQMSQIVLPEAKFCWSNLKGKNLVQLERKELVLNSLLQVRALFGLCDARVNA